MEESFKDFNCGIWIGLLSTDRLSQEKKHYQLKNQFRVRVGTEIVFDLKWESLSILYILFLNSILAVIYVNKQISETD